jgi:hypothetical protein
MVFFWLTEYLSPRFNRNRISRTLIETTTGGKMSRDELVKKIASDTGITQKGVGVGSRCRYLKASTGPPKRRKVPWLVLAPSAVHTARLERHQSQTQSSFENSARNVPVFNVAKKSKTLSKN